MAEKIQKHSNTPRIVVQLPGYASLTPDMRELIDARMKARAEERDRLKGQVEPEEGDELSS
jgi:hypothetical protein